MQKRKFNLIWLSFMTISLTPLFVLACTNPISDKDKGGDGKEVDETKDIKQYKFTEKVVDEKWNNIDVTANTLEEWLKIKQIYEQAIIDLNQINHDLKNTQENEKYYKNLFYICWYLRIIGKSNQNISWLKFKAKFNDILEDDILQTNDKEVNFMYALYVQQRLPESIYNFEYDYFFKNFVKYYQGDLLNTYIHIPNDYLNFGTQIINSSDIMYYYRSFMLWEDRDNIWKVLQYFQQKKDQVNYKNQIEINNKAFEKRWNDKIWNPPGAITNDYAYRKWLAKVSRGGTKIEDYSFNQLSWEKWIKV